MAKKKHKKASGKEPRTPEAPEPESVNGTGRVRTLSEMVPVRFDPEVLAEIRRRPLEDERSVSAWIRRAVDRELRRDEA